MENQRNYKEEYNTLIQLLKEMRRHQSDFFKTNSKQSLAWAKDYERRVDKIIENEENPKLF